MSNRVAELRPPYPMYAPQPMFGGRLQTINEDGPPDMKPTSIINPSYSIYRGTRGRQLTGLGDSMHTQTQSADEGIRDYPNELNLLAAADDVQGNGVFDPPGTPGNVHPNEGVFADHESLPGYIVRDQFYEPSQVIDGTTGNPVMYVPSGAVAIDAAQREAYRELRDLYELPPTVSPRPTTVPPGQSTWIPREYAYPVSGLGQETEPDAESGDREAPSMTQYAVGAAVVGAAIGIFAATIWGQKGLR